MFTFYAVSAYIQRLGLLKVAVLYGLFNCLIALVSMSLLLCLSAYLLAPYIYIFIHIKAQK